MELGGHGDYHSKRSTSAARQSPVQVAVVLRTGNNVLAFWSHYLPFKHIVGAEPVQRAESAVATTLRITASETNGRTSPTSDSISFFMGRFVCLVGLDTGSEFDGGTRV